MIDESDNKIILKNYFKQQKLPNPQDIFKQFISQNEEHLSFIATLRNPKKSTCGKKIEISTLSFQCFDCAPDPHHMFCTTCFVLPKHKGHKFIMRHNIGGCCDCGDESSIDRNGSCSDHNGLDYINHFEEKSKIPEQLSSSIADFIRLIILYYYKNIQKSGLNYPIGLIMCETILRLMAIQDTNLSKEIEMLKAKEISIKKQEFGVFLYNICFEFIEWLIDSSMPMIELITELLMEIPKIELQNKFKLNSTNDTFIDMVVKSAAIVDNGQIYSKKLHSILYTLNANAMFKSFLQQSMIKYYEHLIIQKQEYSGGSTKWLDRIQESIISWPVQQNEIHEYLTQVNISVVRNYLEKLKSSGPKKQNTIIQYQANLHSHHTQYVSKELQEEFFASPYINRFYDSLGFSYALLTKRKIDESTFAQRLYWLNLKTEYSFFPQIVQNQLQQWLLPQDFNFLTHGNLLTQKFIITEEFANHFIFTNLLKAYSIQEPADQYSEDLFDNLKDALSYAINYLNIQQNFLGVLFDAFAKVIISSKNQQFNLNLSIVMLKYTYRLLEKRNIFDQKIQRYSRLNEENIKQTMTLSRLLSANATAIDRSFTYFLMATIFLSNLDKQELLLFLQFLFTQNHSTIINEISQAMDRAVQSYFSAQIGGSKDDVYKLYNGTFKQSSVCLISHDLTLIKIFLYLSGYVGQLCESMKKHCSTIQDHYLIKYKLILELLLSDQDLLNVSGSLFKVLPLDLRNYFRKFMRSVFMLQDIHVFQDLKLICLQAGMSKNIKIQNFILDVCEIQGYEMQLKLKTLYQDEDTYEPLLIENCPDLLDLITKSIKEANSIVEPNIGNGIINDLRYPPTHEQATMGPIRYDLWVQILGYPDLISNLFSDVLSKKRSGMIVIPTGLIRILQTIYILIQANNVLQLLTNHQQTQLQTLVDLLKNNKINSRMLIQIFNLINEALSSRGIMQNEQPASENINLASRDNSKFTKLQQEFQENINIGDEISLQIQQTRICQLCKLQIQSDQKQCIPGLLDQINMAYYFPKIQADFSFAQTVLISCKHRFHSKCLYSSYKKIKMSTAHLWLQLQCPECKQAITSAIPFILNIQDDNQIKRLFNKYYDSIIAFVNINTVAASHYFRNYDHISDQKDKLNLIFLECNISLITNMFIEMFVNPIEFYRTRDDELLANTIKLLQYFKKYLVGNQQIIDDYLDKTFQQYIQLDHYVGQQVVVIIGSLLNRISKVDVKQILDMALYLQLKKFETQDQQLNKCLIFLGKSTTQMIFSNSYVYSEMFVPDYLAKLNQQSTVSKQQVFGLLRNRLGKTFKQFYDTYFQGGCMQCHFFPLVRTKDKIVDLMVCLLCSFVLCLGQCNNLKNSQFGNMNNHANEYHCSQTIFVSLTTGQASLVVNPITILNYKNLFYDCLGQTVEIHDPKVNWDDYLLDEKQVNSLTEILISNRLKQVIRNEIERKHTNVNGQIDHQGIF